MITLISPAKSLDYDTHLPLKEFSIPNHLPDSKSLMKSLRFYDPDNLSSLMGVSEKLAILNFERNMNWSPPVRLEKNSRQAIYAFKGDVYMGIDSYSLSKNQIKFLNNHLRILSGLYGILKPLDLIKPYRLEMGTNINNSKGKNLYEFWGNKITASVNESLSTHRNKTVVNLASVEYFSSVKLSGLEGKVVKPTFKDYKKGKYKIISFFAKRARGLMVRYLAENKIDRPEDLNNFNLGGYKYSKKDSSELEPVFLRKQI